LIVSCSGEGFSSKIYQTLAVLWEFSEVVFAVWVN
jgi:hypothetical protein